MPVRKKEEHHRQTLKSEKSQGYQQKWIILYSTKVVTETNKNAQINFFRILEIQHWFTEFQRVRVCGKAR